MIQSQIQAEIKRIKDILVINYNPQKIILFGSHVWGKPNADSDLDFFIIKDVKIPRPKREQEIYRILVNHPHERNIPVDVIVHTPKETEERLDLGDPLITEIVHRGRVIYERF